MKPGAPWFLMRAYVDNLELHGLWWGYMLIRLPHVKSTEVHYLALDRHVNSMVCPCFYHVKCWRIISPWFSMLIHGVSMLFHAPLFDVFPVLGIPLYFHGVHEKYMDKHGVPWMTSVSHVFSVTSVIRALSTHFSRWIDRAYACMWSPISSIWISVVLKIGGNSEK